MIKFYYPEGATPLNSSETKGLIPRHIALQSELDEWEAFNITEAKLWIQRQPLNNFKILETSFLKTLHKQMFDKTWSWAGEFRKTEKNIGVSSYKIGTELKQFLEDVKYWQQNETYSAEEIATRLHHKLVWIHPFSNGNGRFSRLMADIFLKINHCEPFSWGSSNLISQSDTRFKYIAALQSADQHDFSLLINFVRS